MKHYLISLPLPRQGMDAHCYLMTNNPAHVEVAANKLVHSIEQAGGEVVVPIVLSTPLSSASARKVRAAVRKISTDRGKTLSEAKNFHYTGWAMPASDPVSIELMALH